MRATHYIRLTLVAVFQALLVAALLYLDSRPFESKPPRWIPNSIAIAMLLIPFISYVLVAFNAPIFQKWSRTRKTIILPIFSFLLTIAGMQVWMGAGLIIQINLRGYI